MARDESPVVLRVELSGVAEALAGKVSTEAGWSMRFAGWMGLAAAIEQAIERTATAPK